MRFSYFGGKSSAYDFTSPSVSLRSQNKDFYVLKAV